MTLGELTTQRDALLAARFRGVRTIEIEGNSFEGVTLVEGTGPFAFDGDSGALVFRQANWCAVGIVIASSSAGQGVIAPLDILPQQWRDIFFPG